MCVLTSVHVCVRVRVRMCVVYLKNIIIIMMCVFSFCLIGVLFFYYFFFFFYFFFFLLF